MSIVSNATTKNLWHSTKVEKPIETNDIVFITNIGTPYVGYYDAKDDVFESVPDVGMDISFIPEDVYAWCYQSEFNKTVNVAPRESTLTAASSELKVEVS